MTGYKTLKLNVSPLCELNTNKELDDHSNLYLLAVNGFRTVIYNLFDSKAPIVQHNSHMWYISAEIMTKMFVVRL